MATYGRKKYCLWSGTVFNLRGVNLGGWLVEETWMMPFETVPPPTTDFRTFADHVCLWAMIDRRFSRVDGQNIRAALRNAWLTKNDVKRVAAAGLNCVRVPFLYDFLDEPEGFRWLDRIVDWARSTGIYVIFDLHGAPGRQSEADHTGEGGGQPILQRPCNATTN